MFRSLIRSILLRLLTWTERDPMATAVRRGGAANVWKKEINIPSPVVAAVISNRSACAAAHD